VDRRTFIGTLAGSLLAAPLAVEAQPGKIYRVGFVSPTFGAVRAVWRSTVAFVTAV